MGGIGGSIAAPRATKGEKRVVRRTNVANEDDLKWSEHSHAEKFG